MRNVKGILAALLVLGILFTALEGGFANGSFDTDFEENVKLLSAINILKGDSVTTLKPEGTMTRAEFASVLTNLLGINDVKVTDEELRSFSDVSSAHQAAGSIFAVYRLGLMSRNINGTFKPDEPIVYSEAVKAMVVLLGYGSYLNLNPGRYLDYYMVGSQIRLTRKISGSLDAAANNKMLVQLLVNSLEIDLMEQIGAGETVKMKTTEGVNLLSKKLEIKKGSGQVNANMYTQLGLGKTAVKEGEVEIDGEKYKVGNTDAHKYLGRIVTYYARINEKTDEKTLIWVKTDETKCSVITVNAENIDDSTSLETFTYWEDKEKSKSTTEVSISDIATVIFNGKYYGKISTFNVDYLKPERGNITLIDANKDDDYEIILVTIYDTLVVDRVNALYEKITDKFYNNRVLSLDNPSADFRYNIIKDGNAIKLEDLKEWDVISVSVSEDMKLINLIVTNNSFTGKIDEKSDEEITVEGKAYKLSPHFSEVLDVDKSFVFYLDEDGMIAAVDKDSGAARNYAYLYKLHIPNSLSGGVQIKVLKADEYEMTSFDLAEKVEFNRQTIKSKDILNYTAIYNKTTKKTERQLITYELDSNGKVCSIDTAVLVDTNNEETLLKDDIFRHNSQITSEKSFRINSKSFEGEFYLSSAVKVFVVPNQTNAELAEDEESYLTYKISYFKGDIKYNNMTTYDMSEAKVVKAILITLADTAGSKMELTSPLFLVDRIANVINDDGEMVQKLYGIQDKKSMELYTLNKDILTPHNLQRGDVVRLHLDFKDRIDECEVKLRAANGRGTANRFRETSDPASYYYQHFIFVAGEILKIFPEDKKIKIDAGPVAGILYYDYAYSNPFFYVYDQKTDSTYIGSVNDMMEGDMIILRNRWDSVKEIIISRYE